MVLIDMRIITDEKNRWTTILYSLLLSSSWIRTQKNIIFFCCVNETTLKAWIIISEGFFRKIMLCLVHFDVDNFPKFLFYRNELLFFSFTLKPNLNGFIKWPPHSKSTQHWKRIVIWALIWCWISPQISMLLESFFVKVLKIK